MGAGASAAAGSIHSASPDEIQASFLQLPADQQAMLLTVIESGATDAAAEPATDEAPPAVEAAPADEAANAANAAEPAAEEKAEPPAAEEVVAAEAEAPKEAAEAGEAAADEKAAPAPAAEAAAAEAEPAKEAEAAGEAPPVAEAPPPAATEEVATEEKAEPPAPEKGELTEEQKANVQKTFDAIDTNKNGTIEATEFQRACELFGMTVTDGWVADLFTKFDINSDAKIDIDEFTKLILAAVI